MISIYQWDCLNKLNHNLLKIKFNTALQESVELIYGMEDHVVKSEKNFGLCDLNVNPKMVGNGQEVRQSITMGSPFGR